MYDSRLPTASSAPSPAVSRTRRCALVLLDDSEGLRPALRYACLTAHRNGGSVGLLSVIRTPQPQEWMYAGSTPAEESRDIAERRLSVSAGEAKRLSGRPPELFLREGDTLKELLKVVDEDPGIALVVLGAASGARGPGPLITALTGKYSNRLRVPLTIVPGTLTDGQIDDMV